MSILGDCTSVRDLWIEQNLRNAAHQQGVRRVVMVQNLDGTQEIDGDFATKYPEYALGVKVSPRDMAQSDEDYFQQCARGM